MAYNQLLDFLDNLDTSVHRHILMLYEEPEYAKSIQTRFLNDGLRRKECCIYIARDDDDIRITKAEMVESGVDVEYNMKKGLLQFYQRKPTIIDNESYRLARNEFQGEIERTFARVRNGKDSWAGYPKIRGVGSISRNLFSGREIQTSTKAKAVAGQLVAERLFQVECTDSFDGSWLCAYEVDDIFGAMNSEWMVELLTTHDAVMYLPKFSNGIALDIKK